ncbi:MaoC family dehydratase N-terminal domain-containing protein [Thermodesulfobacteriota bacterium]
MSVIGKEYPPYTYEVEKCKIREFARAIGEKNPLYHDEEVAREEGFDGIVAPPTFGTVFYVEGGLMYTIIQDVKGDLIKMLQGGQEYQYFKPIHPGMIITAKTKIADIFEKASKAGTMSFVVIETTFTDQADEKVLSEKLTVIFRE